MKLLLSVGIRCQIKKASLIPVWELLCIHLDVFTNDLEPRVLQSMGLQRVEHNSANEQQQSMLRGYSVLYRLIWWLRL